MAIVLFDTNILIDALKGYRAAATELAFWDAPAISAVSVMEIYAGASRDDIPRLDRFVAQIRFEIIHTDDKIAKEAAAIRAGSRNNSRKIALPDAIIMATANVRSLTVITRNRKDFKGWNVRVPYELETTTLVNIINVAPPGKLPSPPRRSHPRKP
jgi:predicted nucleic acid-binding protein